MRKFLNIDLCFSLTSSFLFVGIRSDEWLDFLQRENFRLHSDNFIFHLQKLLEANSLNLSQIENIYFTSHPGSHTGIRISLAFLTTLQVLNPQVRIYHINTLLFQAGNDSCVSLLTLDNRASKYYVGVYQNKQEIMKWKIASKEEVEDIKKKFALLTHIDLQSINFSAQFDQLKDQFVMMNNVEQLDLDNLI